jgi:predicted AAA+ superfamily ATPase
LVIKGIRRAGKSALVYLLMKNLIKKKKIKKEDSLIINFEDPRFPENLQAKDLMEIYESYLKELKPSKKQIIALDEVQKVKGWEKFARFLKESKKQKVIVTGSSSKLLSEEYATVLSGRHLDLEVFPLSFKEFLDFKNLKIKDEISLIKNRIKIKRLFDDYLKFGGFPEIVLIKKKEELLREYFRDIIVKDIIKRFKIREISKIEDLAKFYLTNIGNPISFNKVKNYLKLSLDTTERFSKYLEIARLCFFLPKFSFSLKSQILSPKKVYSIDSGLSNTIGFRFSENLGQTLENIAFLEFQRKKELFPEKEIYYLKMENGKEVDFLLKQRKKIKTLFQVCAKIEDFFVKEREIKGLILASKKLNCNDLVIITEDFEGGEKIKGRKIKFLPLWKWLLQ